MITALLCLSLTAASSPPVLQQLQVNLGDGAPKTFAFGQDDAYLEPGDDFATASIEVRYDTARADRVTVEMRYQTQAIITMEGPHAELKGMTGGGGWEALQPSGKGFRVGLTEAEITRMPPFTPAQINARVAEVTTDYTCTSLRDGWCSVGLSTVWLQVTAWKGDKPVEGQLIAIDVPLGC